VLFRSSKSRDKLHQLKHKFLKTSRSWSIDDFIESINGVNNPIWNHINESNGFSIANPINLATNVLIRHLTQSIPAKRD